VASVYCLGGDVFLVNTLISFGVILSSTCIFTVISLSSESSLTLPSIISSTSFQPGITTFLPLALNFSFSILSSISV